MNKNYLLIIPLTLCLSFTLSAEQRKDGLFEQVRPIRVMKIELYDQGSVTEGAHDLAIDTQQGLCETEENVEPELEPFFDTLAGIYVYNKTAVPIRFETVRFFIDKLGNNSYKSKKLSLANIGDVESGATTRLLALLLHTKDGGKYLYPSRGPLPFEAGATNVKFILNGRSASGQRVKTVGKIALVFRDVDRCE